MVPWYKLVPLRSKWGNFVTGGFPRLHRKRGFCGYLAGPGMDQTNL